MGSHLTRAKPCRERKKLVKRVLFVHCEEYLED